MGFCEYILRLPKSTDRLPRFHFYIEPEIDDHNIHIFSYTSIHSWPLYGAAILLNFPFLSLEAGENDYPKNSKRISHIHLLFDTFMVCDAVVSIVYFIYNISYNISVITGLS